MVGGEVGAEQGGRSKIWRGLAQTQLRAAVTKSGSDRNPKAWGAWRLGGKEQEPQTRNRGRGNAEEQDGCPTQGLRTASAAKPRQNTKLRCGLTRGYSQSKASQVPSSLSQKNWDCVDAGKMATEIPPCRHLSPIPIISDIVSTIRTIHECIHTS